jgi:DHA1 family tetracycline resistance protein-like MFS transporter
MDRKVSPHGQYFVLLVVLIDSIGFGIILPVTPQLIMEVTGEPLSAATRIGGWLLVVYALLQFVCGPLMGNLSDRFGRRPVLIFSMLAFAVDYFLMAMAPTLAWLFLGRAVAGIAGASYGPANAYLADITPPEKRAASFGLMGAAFGLGFILGPAIGGLLGGYGTRAPFYAAAALGALNVIYGYFFLPESLPQDRRRAFSLKRANPLGTLMTFAKYPGVLTIVLAMLLWQIAHQVYPATWSFYAIAKFDWSPQMIGWSLAWSGMTMAIIQAFFTGKIVAAMGERAAAMLAMAVGSSAFLAYAFVPEGWMVFVIMVVGVLQAVAYPSMNALLSRQLKADEQGELQGGVASIYSIGTIVGPFLMTQSLAAFTDKSASTYFPGAAFLLAAVLGFVALTILWLTMRGRERAGQEAAPAD